MLQLAVSGLAAVLCKGIFCKRIHREKYMTEPTFILKVLFSTRVCCGMCARRVWIYD